MLQYDVTINLPKGNIVTVRVIQPRMLLQGHLGLPCRHYQTHHLCCMDEQCLSGGVARCVNFTILFLFNFHLLDHLLGCLRRLLFKLYLLSLKRGENSLSGHPSTKVPLQEFLSRATNGNAAKIRVQSSLRDVR